MKVTYKHELPAPFRAVIDTYRDPRFYEAKQKHFGAVSLEILQWDEDEDGVLRYRVKVTEPSRQPAFIRKSDTDTYIDESQLDTKKGTLTWKVIPEVGTDKFSINGSVEFQPNGEQSTTGIYQIEFSVKIPLVGKKIEKYVLDKSEEETAKQVRFVKDWLEQSANP